MRSLRTFVLALAGTFALSAAAFATPFVATNGTVTTAVTAMLNKSADDWNRGDIDNFATSYKNSPDILFIGHTISRGYAQMLASYKAAYSTREKMGRLSFSQLDVQPLDERFVTVTGHFHLERTTTGGGNADGYFLLVVEDTPAGWKIVRDDTTSLTPAK